MLTIPVFNSSKHPVDFSIPPFLRAVAVVKIKQTDLFLVYSRQDGFLRFPGGHQEDGEKAVQTAIRETQEEVGVSGLEFVSEIGSCHIFYDYKDRLSHLIANYFLFQLEQAKWEARKKPEDGVYPCLKTSLEIQTKSWEQNQWLFKKLADIPLE